MVVLAQNITIRVSIWQQSGIIESHLCMRNIIRSFDRFHEWCRLKRAFISYDERYALPKGLLF